MSQSRGEGLDYFTKGAGLLLLRYIAGSQTDLNKMLLLVREATETFEDAMRCLLKSPHMSSYEELTQIGVMKPKYLPYSAYMATISAYPLLKMKATMRQILSTVLAKMALILSIKVLDNINDTFHTTEEAAESLQRQKEAIVHGRFIDTDSGNVVKRAENSCVGFGLLVNKWLQQNTPTATASRQSFFNDFEVYINGQAATFKQQNRADRQKITIRDYLRLMNEKGVGRIWVGLDLSMLEHVSDKSTRAYKGYEYVRKGFDYCFKSSNYYDDVADLEADLKMGIWNSVVYLGKDLGVVDNPEDSLTNTELQRYTVRLGDLHFIIGLEYLKAASKYVIFDQKSMLASMNVFRFFTVRKWFFQSKNPAHFFDFLVARVPKKIMNYSKLI